MLSLATSGVKKQAILYQITSMRRTRSTELENGARVVKERANKIKNC